MAKRTEPSLPGRATAIYEEIKELPIVSPHGHCDPKWWAEDREFPNPVALLIQPDHYVFRMLYSQGVSLAELGIGPRGRGRDPREIFRVFARSWHLFVGTPTRVWLEHTLYQTIGIEEELAPETADSVYDAINKRIADPAFRPRALFDRFGISFLATTDAATSALDHHAKIKASGWPGRVVPTFRPDDLIDPSRRGHAAALAKLAEMTGRDVYNYDALLDAIRDQRAAFRAAGATATDHDVPELATRWMDRDKITALHARAISGDLTEKEARDYYGHMLVEMAQMSAEDGLVMQLHVGSCRNTNLELLEAIGPDMGADIPIAIDWVDGMSALLNRVGNDPRLRVIMFTLDESAYARELAPMAGHWPCLRIGPPWWFHDSPNGIKRYFDRVIETAGYYNLAGFNDDTRAFLSIPARHDLWRRGVALHLAEQLDRGVIPYSFADPLAKLLAVDLAVETYRLDRD